MYIGNFSEVVKLNKTQLFWKFLKYNHCNEHESLFLLMFLYIVYTVVLSEFCLSFFLDRGIRL